MKGSPDTLTPKRRLLLMASDGEWRTIDELLAIAEEYRPPAARPGDRFTRAWVERTLLEFNGVLWDYGQATTEEHRRRKGHTDGMWRLNRAGRILQAELRRLS